VLGVCKGEPLLQLGGENGISLFIQQGDVLIIPAGVAHKNLGKENDLICVGAYPDGRDYDMNYGKHRKYGNENWLIQTQLLMPFKNKKPQARGFLFSFSNFISRL